MIIHSSRVYSPLLGLSPIFCFLVLYTSARLFGRGISPSQESYLHTRQYKQINIYRHACFACDSNPRTLVFERSKAVHTLAPARPLSSAVSDFGYRPILLVGWTLKYLMQGGISLLSILGIITLWITTTVLGTTVLLEYTFVSSEVLQLHNVLLLLQFAGTSIFSVFIFRFLILFSCLIPPHLKSPLGFVLLTLCFEYLQPFLVLRFFFFLFYLTFLSIYLTLLSSSACLSLASLL
jgi:hypothetical protein